jgi:hypothetical protein
MVEDREIRHHISDLVDEERDLRRKLARHEITAEDERARLSSVEAELDQCWDLLRQREARREFGEDPEQARVRSEDVVERYQG